MMRNKNFPNQNRQQQQQQQQNFNTHQFSDQNPNQFMDFSNNFSDQDQAPRAQNRNGQMNRSPKKNNMNFHKNGGNNSKNWNSIQQQIQRRAPPPQMNQNNQFQPFNNPQMNNFRNERAPMNNFRNKNNNNMRNNNIPPMNFPMQRSGPPMNMNMMPMPGNSGRGPIPPAGPMRRPPMRSQFQKFNKGNGKPANTNPNVRKNPNLTKVDKPKNRKPQQPNMQNIKKNVGRGKKRQRDPYSLEAPFVTDEIKEEHKKKEDILESLKGKGKNDDLFAKFKETRDIFVKKYDEAKVAYQAEKKVRIRSLQN